MFLPAPGEERQWFDNLPARLREYLKSLGTTEKTSLFDTRFVFIIRCEFARIGTN